MKIFNMLLLLFFCFVFTSESHGAALTLQTVSDTGAALAFADADQASGDTIPVPGSGPLFIAVENRDGGSDAAVVTITAVITSRIVPGMGTVARADQTISLAAGDKKIIALPVAPYRNSSNNVAVSYTGAGNDQVYIAPFVIDPALK